MTITHRLHPLATLQRRERVTLFAHAFVGWALCSATMMIGLAVTTEMTALVIHAIGAPIFAAAVAWNYFRRYGFTTPFQTALVFVAFVVVVDSFLVALLIERSFEMFASPLGTWIPFTLIFLSAYFTGTAVEHRYGHAAQHR